MNAGTLIVPGALLALLIPTALRAAEPAAEPAAAPKAEAKGIAARYPGDAGIAKDTDVIFADDFEAWQEGGTKPPAGAWNVRKGKTGRARTVAGQVTTPDGAKLPGQGVLEIACWTRGSGSSVGGLWKKLGNYNHANEGLGDGHEELFIRYYVRFDDAYEAVRNHGANLGGRDVTKGGSAWVGMAGIRDVSTRGYFYSGVQPRGKLGGRELEIGFYSYHLDKRGPWGENYPVQRRLPLRVGTWHCVERHMKLNSVDRSKADPARADGVEELWIDGRLSIHKQGVRFRRTPNLRITYLGLETYYHGLPARYGPTSPIKVYFDNLVIARRYIGPAATKAGPPQPAASRALRARGARGIRSAEPYNGLPSYSPVSVSRNATIFATSASDSSLPYWYFAMILTASLSAFAPASWK